MAYMVEEQTESALHWRDGKPDNIQVTNLHKQVMSQQTFLAASIILNQIPK